MEMMTKEQTREFATIWLAAWTNSDPEKLCSFYADDAFYLDPNIPKGIKGKEQLLAYFQKILSDNPDWVWSQIEDIPMEDGFLNKWHACIPVGPETIDCVGLSLIQFNSHGEISRNEVHFDRTKLVNAIIKYNKIKK